MDGKSKFERGCPKRKKNKINNRLLKKAGDIHNKPKGCSKLCFPAKLLKKYYQQE